MKIKNLFSIGIIAGLFLGFGCESNKDGVVLPLPPSNLTAQSISLSQIDLTWIDNSTNEDGFVVERKSNSENYSVKAAVGADVTKYSDFGLANNSVYTYRVYANNSAGKSLTYSNEATASTLSIPELSTISISSITTTSAISGGKINSNGGSSIISKGVVWSTSPEPILSVSPKTNDGNGGDQFTSSLINLIPNTKYYIRAYATNSLGTAYGNELSFVTQSITDLQLTKLTKTWKLNTVTLDGIDKKTEYSAFQLVMSGTIGATSFGYTTIGRPSLSAWKSSGNLEFGTSAETQIIRDKGTADELPMTYTVTETTLSITFIFYGAGYSARTTSVKGQWIFTFTL